MFHRTRSPRGVRWVLVLAAIAALLLGFPAKGAPVASAAGTSSTFTMSLNPGLATGKPFACPAMQHATATITVSNRFITSAPNDTMTLNASGLPPNTGFDIFIVQNSPFDSGFGGFGFGWYQSDMESSSLGKALVTMQGIFDQETFIDNPATAFNPIHTFNVGFWFDSPTTEKTVCHNTSAPAATPFNGEQNAGLLGMITQNGPLQTIADSPPSAGVNAPSHGGSRAGRAFTFLTTCSHPRGWKHIHTIDLKFTNGKKAGKVKPLAGWVVYDQNADLIRLFDPGTHKWSSGKPGAKRVLNGRYLSINLARSTAHGAGPGKPTIKVSWQITFKSPAVASNYHQLLRIVDDFGVSHGWRTVGTWNVMPGGYAAHTAARHGSPHLTAHRTQAATHCASATCTFSLGVNPGLGAGKPFACPAIQHATGTIAITNRFVTHANLDTMTVNVTGLPPNTDFDLFLVQNSPLEAGFSGFGFGWYQSDMESNYQGRASVVVKGIFDHEVFIENPASPTTPLHTFDVGFWFGSPTQEQAVCGNATAPAATPFNGEQNAGLLAMITNGQPLANI